jgi:hypothetical protein
MLMSHQEKLLKSCRRLLAAMDDLCKDNPSVEAVTEYEEAVREFRAVLDEVDR